MSSSSSAAAAQGSPAPSINSSVATSRPSTPLNAQPEKAPDDSSKLRTFLSILKKFIGVSDIAAVRFSLPAQLLEPQPNLQYWNYLDRPDTFVSIGDSDEPLGRMLGVLRFWFTKDLKYIKGKPCKPYNSTLGEFFRCTWDVSDTLPPLPTTPSKSSSRAPSKPASSAASIASKEGDPVKVVYITEQTSHHPPVSAYFIECPEKGIIARGYDQLSAKFTGTSIRVTPGNYNLGIYVTLKNWDDEEYRMTHVTASLGGFLRGSLNISVSDSVSITCPKTRLKVILQYQEEGWLGRAQNRVEGVIFSYDPATDKYSRIKDVPDKDVLARLDGVWSDKIYYTLGAQPFAKASPQLLLIDLQPLTPAPKTLPPSDALLPNESTRFWGGVTDAILNKQYSLATQLKQELEERQREKAAERKSRGVEWRPRFFTGATTPPGRPELSEEGWEALRGLERGEFRLRESDETAA